MRGFIATGCFRCVKGLPINLASMVVCVWCVMWSDMTLYHVIRCDVIGIWYDMIWYAKHNKTWIDMIWYDLKYNMILNANLVVCWNYFCLVSLYIFIYTYYYFLDTFKITYYISWIKHSVLQFPYTEFHTFRYNHSIIIYQKGKASCYIFSHILHYQWPFVANYFGFDVAVAVE